MMTNNVINETTQNKNPIISKQSNNVKPTAQVPKIKTAEDLMIYKQILQLIYYTEDICKKYPKSEKLSIVTNIKNTTYDCLKNVLDAYKSYEKQDKLNNLDKLDSNLKFLKVLVRVSYRSRYISNKNCVAWIKKITNICNLMGGWYKSCQRH